MGLRFPYALEASSLEASSLEGMLSSTVGSGLAGSTLEGKFSLDNSAMLRNLCLILAGADVHMLQDKKASVTFTVIFLILS